MSRSPLSPSSRRIAVAFVAAAVALILAAPLAAAYMIILKDGSKIAAREKYRIDKNGRAIITLENGNQTFVAADKIDVAKTEAYNKEYGGDLVLPGDPQPIGPATTTPTASRDRVLVDLANRSATPTPTTRRQTSSEGNGGTAVKTRAGFTDLGSVPRRDYPHIEVSSEIVQFFRSQGIDDLAIFAGTKADRPLVEITTGSEGSVFKGLVVAANALLHVRDRYPQRVGAFELLLNTPSRERAGQFVLDPQMATDLVAKTVDVTTFYVSHVQF
jgi:hypothetical protein